MSATEANIYNEYITYDGNKLAGINISKYKGIQQSESTIKSNLDAKVNSEGKVKVSDACSTLYKGVMGW